MSVGLRARMRAIQRTRPQCPLVGGFPIVNWVEGKCRKTRSVLSAFFLTGVEREAFKRQASLTSTQSRVPTNQGTCWRFPCAQSTGLAGNPACPQSTGLAHSLARNSPAYTSHSGGGSLPCLRTNPKCSPPSTAIICPVTDRAPSKYRTASAMPSGVAP